ncbi:hypothetical protein QCA50_008329 [Cerrena zonata]|uniref:Uncharacterized protein n=1 Tax=Cerrena zonata TaxID=2478898 RepID=A0AAW0GBT8_9APHY
MKRHIVGPTSSTVVLGKIVVMKVTKKATLRNTWMHVILTNALLARWAAVGLLNKRLIVVGIITWSTGDNQGGQNVVTAGSISTNGSQPKAAIVALKIVLSRGGNSSKLLVRNRQNLKPPLKPNAVQGIAPIV